MATKEENIARLQELAVQLGREPDISGSAAEISQRVAEWEEEASGMQAGENAETTASDPQDEPESAKSFGICPYQGGPHASYSRAGSRQRSDSGYRSGRGFGTYSGNICS